MSIEEQKEIAFKIRKIVGEQFILIFPVNNTPMIIVGGTPPDAVSKILISVSENFSPNMSKTILTDE